MTPPAAGSEPTQICRLCEAAQPESEFYLRKESGKRRTECRSCLSAVKKARHLADPSKRKARDKRRYWSDRDGRREAAKAWREAHPGYTAEGARRWRQANPERAKELKRRWVGAHVELERERQRRKRVRAWRERHDEMLAYHRRRRELDPERARAAARRWARAHPEAVREQANRRYARKLAATVGVVDYVAVLERDGLVCHLCLLPIRSLRALHFDHVVPLSRQGTHSMDNIRPAHNRCNQWKHAKLMGELDLEAWRARCARLDRAA